MQIGEMLRQWLTKLEWYSTLFPRIPVPIQKSIEAKLREHNATHHISHVAAEPEVVEGHDSKKASPNEYGFGEAERVMKYKERFVISFSMCQLSTAPWCNIVKITWWHNTSSLYNLYVMGNYTFTISSLCSVFVSREKSGLWSVLNKTLLYGINGHCFNRSTTVNQWHHRSIICNPRSVLDIKSVWSLTTSHCYQTIADRWNPISDHPRYILNSRTEICHFCFV